MASDEKWHMHKKIKNFKFWQKTTLFRPSCESLQVQIFIMANHKIKDLGLQSSFLKFQSSCLRVHGPTLQSIFFEFW